MARPNQDLSVALRASAARLEAGAPYSWGHPGACNCGHLAQTVTHLSQVELIERAKIRAGDWGEMVVEYCPTSGIPIDDVIGALLDLGMSRDDLARLEDLSDRDVLRRIARDRRDALRRNSRDDAVLYLRAFADLLDEELVRQADWAASMSASAARQGQCRQAISQQAPWEAKYSAVITNKPVAGSV